MDQYKSHQQDNPKKNFWSAKKTSRAATSELKWEQLHVTSVT